MTTQDQIPYHERLKKIKLGLAPKECVPKPKKYLNKVSPKKAAQIKQLKENGTDKPLDAYFDYHMKNSYPKCENCGMVAEWLLEEKYEFLWRSCQAHVLRKKDSIGGFPSIASNLTNHLVLFPMFAGLCGCHDEFDASYERMAKMAIFPKAIDIINQLYPLIAPDEKKYLPEIIIQEIKPEKYLKQVR